MLYALIGAAAACAVAFFAGGAYMSEPHIERAAQMEAQRDAALATIERQSQAVRTIEQASKARVTASESARKKDNAVLAAEVQRLHAEKPAFKDDPCASACSLLQQPL